jgi:hypothetical protein
LLILKQPVRICGASPSRSGCQIAGTSLSVNRSFASRVFRFKSLSAQSNEPLAAIFDARAFNGAGRFFGSHQIMRSAVWAGREEPYQHSRP